MQNNISSVMDIEFEISGEKLYELEWDNIRHLKQKEKKIAQVIHEVILKKAWDIISLEELKCQIIKNLHFIDLIKVKLDFSEKYNSSSTVGIFTNDLFGWVYYNEDEKIKTFRFVLNVSTGEIKYLNN